MSDGHREALRVIGRRLICLATIWHRETWHLLRDLNPEAFIDDADRRIWKAIVECDRAGAVEPELVAVRLEKNGDYSLAGQRLLEAVEPDLIEPHHAHAEHLRQTLEEAHQRRQWAEYHRGLAEAWSGQASPDEIEAMASDLPSRSSTDASSKWQLLAVPDLLERFPRLREPVIDGLLRRGETGTVIAAAKAGKSWMVYGLAAAVASGRDWLGWPTRRGRVAVIDLELHGETLSSRLRRVCRETGLDPEAMASISVVPLRGREVDIGEIVARSYLLAGVDLIVVDALYRTLPAGVSENDNAQMAQVYNSIDALARETGAAVVLVHHASKGAQTGKAVIDVGSGAGAMARAGDLHLVIRPHQIEGISVIEGAVRSFAPVEPRCVFFKFPLWEAASDDLDPRDLAGLKPSAGQKSRQATEEARDDREAVLEFLKAREGAPANLGAVVVGVERQGRRLGERRTKASLEWLLQSGEIEAVEFKPSPRSKIVRGFRVPTGEPAGDDGWPDLEPIAPRQARLKKRKTRRQASKSRRTVERAGEPMMAHDAAHDHARSCGIIAGPG